MDFEITDLLLIRYSAFVTYWMNIGSAVGPYIGYLKFARKPVIELGGSIMKHSHCIRHTSESSLAN
jgi:hypothetical protein